MKKFTSLLLAIVMVVASIAVSPVTTSAYTAKAEDSKSVTVSKKGAFAESTKIEEAGQIILYKVQIDEAGAYTFQTKGTELDTVGFLLNEFQLSNFAWNSCLEYDNNSGEDYNCLLTRYFKKGDVVYFAIGGVSDAVGAFDVSVVYNEDYVEQDGIVYKKTVMDDDTKAWEVTGYTDENIKKAVIASEINGLKVKVIGRRAFENVVSLSQVVLPDTIEQICDYAFDATGLESVSIPDSVQWIGEWAFGNTLLKSVSIPDSCKEIDWNAFGCAKIKELYIPKNVEYIGFQEIFSLEKFSVAADNANYRAVDGVLYTKDLETLALYPIGKAGTEYQVAEGTEIIGDYSFCGSKLKKVVLPGSVTTIEEEAFQSSELTEIDFGISLKTVGSYAFYGCNNLLTLDFPESVTSISYRACDAENIQSVIIRNKDCKLNSICRDNMLINLYGVADSTAKTYAGSKSNVTFIPINKAGCDKEPAEHQFVKYYTKAPTCTESGETSSKCISCGAAGEIGHISPLGHNEIYVNNFCERCYRIIDASKAKYLTLNQPLVINDEDFGGCEQTVYPFQSQKAGTYTITVSGEPYKCYLAVYIVDYASENIRGYRGYYTEEGKSLTIKVQEGETALVGIGLNGKTIAGESITVTCNHANIETKTTPATCTTAGSKKTVCASCGEVIKTEVIPATGHDFGTNEEKCKNCGAKNSNYVASDMPKTIKDGNIIYTLNKNGEYVAAKATKPSIKKLAKKSKGFKITWKKVSKVKGYQVQYSTTKKFTKKTTKLKTYKGNKKLTKTISKLKGKKKYFVRVRTYKTIKVHGKTVKLYSGWSKVKSVTTKK